MLLKAFTADNWDLNPSLTSIPHLKENSRNRFKRIPIGSPKPVFSLLTDVETTPHVHSLSVNPGHIELSLGIKTTSAWQALTPFVINHFILYHNSRPPRKGRKEGQGGRAGQPHRSHNCLHSCSLFFQILLIYSFKFLDKELGPSQNQ